MRVPCAKHEGYSIPNARLMLVSFFGSQTLMQLFCHSPIGSSLVCTRLRESFPQPSALVLAQLRLLVSPAVGTDRARVLRKRCSVSINVYEPGVFGQLRTDLCSDVKKEMNRNRRYNGAADHALSLRILRIASGG
jgi:hypothetical protein